MKTFNFNQTGGFKLTTDTFSAVQSAYKIYSGVAKMAGDKAILSGCEVIGNTVSDGYVVIDGELLEFKGSIKQDTVIIKEEITTVDYEDGSIKTFETNRYAAFGFSAGAFQWADFKRVPVLIDLPQQLTNISTTLNNKIDALANSIGFLRKGNIFIGDINAKAAGWTYSGEGYTVQLMNAGVDELYRVTFTTPLEVSDYRVYTSINYVGSYVFNNDVISAIANKNAAGFDISIREVSADVQNINLDYIIFKK